MTTYAFQSWNEIEQFNLDLRWDLLVEADDRCLEGWEEVEALNSEIRWTLLEESERNEHAEVIDLLGGLLSIPRRPLKRASASRMSDRRSALNPALTRKGGV